MPGGRSDPTRNVQHLELCAVINIPWDQPGRLAQVLGLVGALSWEPREAWRKESAENGAVSQAWGFGVAFLSAQICS